MPNILPYLKFYCEELLYMKILRVCPSDVATDASGEALCCHGSAEIDAATMHPPTLTST